MLLIRTLIKVCNWIAIKVITTLRTFLFFKQFRTFIIQFKKQSKHVISSTDKVTAIVTLVLVSIDIGTCNCKDKQELKSPQVVVSLKQTYKIKEKEAQTDWKASEIFRSQRYIMWTEGRCWIDCRMFVNFSRWQWLRGRVCLCVQRLCSPQNVNCRDVEGRQSTPLHFAAGFNRLAVVQFLLQHGADVHAKDKGWAHICCFSANV